VSTWRYLLRFAVRNLTVNRLMNVVAVGTTALALFIVAGVVLVHQNVARTLEGLLEQTPVILYLEDEADREEVSDLQSRLLARDDVTDVEYRSKEEAWEAFRRSLRLEGDLLEGLEGNPLPASLHVNLDPAALEHVENIAAEFQEWSGVESVDYGREIIEHLRGFSNVIQVALGGTGVIISIVAIFIIFNTIRLSVISCSTEIDILKLVGATRWFIGFPFVVSGIAYGFFGSILGQGLLWILYWLVQSRVAEVGFMQLQLFFLSPLWIFLIICLGSLLGVIGSATAVRRAIGRM